MGNTDRRTFLKLMGSGAFAASLPINIRRALAVPAHNRTGTIEDVEHIIVLTQENRSFDHLFGTMRGVRGFADPRAVTLPSGKPVWNQPTGSGELLPFRPDVDSLGMSFLADPPHGWNDTHAAWNGGRHDQWVPNKGIDTMTFHRRVDIPFHYALADAFTICDAYHCSVMGPTDPNRYHLWSGWLGNDGAGGGPVITNAEAGYDWSAYPERLVRAGVSWKVYQDVGVGLDAAGYWGWTGDPYIGNYGDNSLLYLHQYQNALPGTPLADGAKVGTNIADHGTLFDMFRSDVESGNLPQVSWIAAPEAYTEHPNWPANYGAWYVSQFIDILASNPDVWSKTVLFLNYDEEGGFFDHMVPPTPAPSADLGASTVDIVNEIYPGDPDHQSAPYGLGMRVPMIVVSPWSKGGWVNSQVFDHTSVIRFIEARFGAGNSDMIEANITPWRRAVAGDLTSAFNFTTPNARPVRLPSTVSFAPPDRALHDDLGVVPPTQQAVPSQERGVRPARALPYALHAHGTVNAAAGSVRIDFENTGNAAAVFQVHSRNQLDAPRTYTVESNNKLSGSWNVAAATSEYHLSVHGPNGFFRAFNGTAGSGRANLKVRASYDKARNSISLTIVNSAAHGATVRILDTYTGNHSGRPLSAGDTLSRHWTLDNSHGWYDLVITIADDPSFEYRLAGHVETGHDSISDPAMGGLVNR
jgi:phospholipase C